MKAIEREYEQFRDTQINGIKYKNDEYIISYSAFLIQKGIEQTARKRLVNIRTTRLIKEAQSTPLGPFTWTEEKIDKRVR
uniref:Uncharacterized protein n=1 Tax=viral metagenome TaxID=1070528 RepID=A0A6H1ZRX4_9ZZZZ